MGQKVNPISNRLGFIKGWDSNWFGGDDYGDKLVEDQKLFLEVTEGAIDVLCEEGYDPAFGARPLKRAIQRLVPDPLSKRILSGVCTKGSKITVSAKDGKLEIS